MNNFDSNFNLKVLMLITVGLSLLSILALMIMPDVLSLINAKVSSLISNFINSQI